MKRGWLLVLVFLLSISAVFAHDGGEEEDKETIPWPIWTIVGYGTALFVALIYIMVHFKKQMKDHTKKFVYALVVLTVGFVSLYLIITTIYVNVTSVTGGPVHWHADYEVWACGENLKLVDPTFPSNKVGTAVFHDHGENRIHIEGVVSKMADASLHSFFKIVGGELTLTSIGFPTDEEYVYYGNGMQCASGKPGTLYVFVNGEQVDDFTEYVLAPYETVPPGDNIKIIFTDEPLENIDPNTRGSERERKI